MLALNVSSDVLDGFVQVEDGLAHTNINMGQRNAAIYNQLEALTMTNAAQATPLFTKATQVRKRAAELYDYIDSLKLMIVRQADGPDGKVNDIQRRDDLEAASVVMLNPLTHRGADLRADVESYRDYVCSFIGDKEKRASIEAMLSTEPFKRPGMPVDLTWEEAKFDTQPVVAAVTLLTKLQNDVRYAEGEALSNLLNSFDTGELRVNQLDAFVIPESKMVMRGGRYSAEIVLAAIDTAARPKIFVGGRQISNGKYEFNAGAVGTHDYSGYILVPHPDGSETRHEFKSSYTVIEPSATISPTMMNVLYAGINNPISISVPGVPMSAVNASMTNGTLTRNGDTWIAKPAAIGQEAVITVSANIDGGNQTVGSMSFRVRKLPDPVAFITYQGNAGPERYKGGKPFSKAALLASSGLDAAIDDDLLNIDFKVLGFETVFFDQMGNAIPEVSAGAQFSQRQKDSFKRLSRGKRFYISRIRAIGPDGVERLLSPVEVIVN